MSKEKRRVPKLRFPGFTEDWEQCKLSDLTDAIGDGLHGTPKYNEQGEVAFINGNNLVDGHIVVDETTKFVNEEELSLDDKKITDTTLLMSINGTIGNVARYQGEKIKLGKSVAYITPNKILRDFLYHLLLTSKVQTYFFQSLTGTTIKNLGLKAIRDTTVLVPQCEEQQAIGNFLNNVEKTITLHQRKLEHLNLKKKALLQKLFPKNGERYPELRFPGFTDAWKQRNLGDFVKIDTGKLDANAMQENGQYDFYTSGVQKYKIDCAAFEGPAITIAGNGATVGYMHLADGLFNAYQRTYVLSQFTEDRQYLFYEIGRQLPKKIFKEARTGSIPYIVMDMLESLQLSISTSQENKKIAQLLSFIDKTITLHQRKLEHLQLQKKALLQQMFV